jgi:hypothetical protein
MIQLELWEAGLLGAILVVSLASLAFVSIGLFHYKGRAEKKAAYLKDAIREKETLWTKHKRLQYKYDAIVAVTQEND